MRKFKITFEQILEYIKNPDTQTITISELKESNPACFSLFTMIDNSLKHANLQNIDTENTNTGYQELEMIILEQLSGNITKHNSERFLSLITSHPDYFRRILDTFDTESIQAASLENIEIADNNTLFEIIKGHESKKEAGKSFSLLHFKSSLKSFFQNLFMQKKPHYALISIVVLIFSIITSKTFFQETAHNPVYTKYFQSANLPCEYYETSTRGNSVSLDTDTQYNKTLNQYKFAMADYIQKNYQDAKKSLNSIITDIESGSTQSLHTTTNGKQLLRDIYFYTGICDLALAGKSLDTSLIESASDRFNSAKKLVLESNMKGGDREFFFMGLTFNLLGNDSRSLEYLGNIQENSIYYRDSQVIVSQLTNP